MRVWRGNDCIQTITHPAISVWGVTACSENGDIVSGASDRIVRVFSRDKERQAESEVIQAFENSVKESSIPQQQIGEVNKEKLPGPEFLHQKSGTKEGQVVMIREIDGSVSAHQWSSGANSWMSVGTVVDAVASSGRKKDYMGKDYDYVFDVDIEDGKPPLKLPYNLSQNPYEAATKFIQDNELPMTYLDQVANFITSNTQGETIGQSSQPVPAGSDPYGTESRYRPGDTSSVPNSSTATPTRPKVLPQTTYLSIKTANLKTIQKKIEELNSALIDNGAKDIALNPPQIELFQNLIKHLDQPASAATSEVLVVTDGLDLVMGIITSWPPAQRLPGLDLLRLLAAATPLTASHRTPSGGSVIDVLESSGVFSEQERNSNNAMLAMRVFANLFETDKGRSLADDAFEQIHTLVKAATSQETPTTANRNLTVAVTTLYINYAVLCTSATHASFPSSTDRALILVDDLTSIISTATDSEAMYRALVAVGTLLTLESEELTMAAKEIYGLEKALGKAETGVREPRIRGVVAEIRGLLG